MLEEEINEKEKRYLRFINILIILNIFMVIVVIVIYLHKKAPPPVMGRTAAGMMPPNFRIRPVKDTADAKKRTLEYLNNLGLEGLSLKRVVTFKNYYFIYVKENLTDRTAFALKLIKLGEFTLKKFPTRYPQVMWNNKYGPSASLDEGDFDKMKMTMEKAKQIALDVAKKLGESYNLTKNPDKYYGFYEFIVFQNKVAVGDISINGESEKVFFKMYPNAPLEFHEFI
jgi:hypothetical protein